MDAIVSSLVGGVVGALVGSVSSWLFARQLRTSAERQSRTRELDLAVARLIEAISAWEAAGASFSFSFGIVRDGGAQTPAPFAARGQAFAAVNVALMAASSAERATLKAARAHMLGDTEKTKNLEGLTDVLLRWRQGELSNPAAVGEIGNLWL